uniref:Uncharacterized protein n=1 Tax=Phenylobacterium glaciei TaxID=2803784 RepID=A0A974P604_9CAUL|nr:hypothetical protein JKL49_12730 [Phenylobacterium glaciei]
MSRTAQPGPKLAAWCGWVMAGGLALTPIIGWLAPLAFAPLLTIMGVLTLPALRIEEEDRPVGIAIVTLVLWAAGSSAWSPFTAKDLGESTAAKLIAETVVFFAAICAARAAAPGRGPWPCMSWPGDGAAGPDPADRGPDRRGALPRRPRRHP